MLGFVDVIYGLGKLSSMAAVRLMHHGS